MKIVRNLPVFGGDHIRAAAHAFAANFADWAGDEPKNLIVSLAAEGAIAVAHEASSEMVDMPQSESGAVAPVLSSAGLRTAYVFAGKDLRFSQFHTADHDRPVRVMTACLPPRAAITSSVEESWRIFVMSPMYFTNRDNTSPQFGIRLFAVCVSV